MSDYRALIAPPAWDAITNLPAKDAARVFDAIESLETNPRPSGVVKLSSSSDFYRVRVGDYRIVYDIQDDELIVLVVKVGNRSEVYKKRH